MKLIPLIAVLALIMAASLVEESDAFRGVGGRFGGGFGRFGGGWGWGRGWGWGGFGWPWWAYGGLGGGWGLGKRDVADINTVCTLTSTIKMDNNVTLHCKSPTKEFTCNGLSNLNPAWKIKLQHLALIPVDHTAAIADWDVKVLSMDDTTHSLKNFTTMVDEHELTVSLVANETNMVPGYLFQDPCWTDFINLVKDTKIDNFEFDMNDE